MLRWTPYVTALAAPGTAVAYSNREDTPHDLQVWTTADVTLSLTRSGAPAAVIAGPSPFTLAAGWRIIVVPPGTDLVVTSLAPATLTTTPRRTLTYSLG